MVSGIPDEWPGQQSNPLKPPSLLSRDPLQDIPSTPPPKQNSGENLTRVHLDIVLGRGQLAGGVVYDPATMRITEFLLISHYNKDTISII